MSTNVSCTVDVNKNVSTIWVVTNVSVQMDTNRWETENVPPKKNQSLLLSTKIGLNTQNLKFYKGKSLIFSHKFTSESLIFFDINRYRTEKKVGHRIVCPFRGHSAPRLFLLRFSFVDRNSSEKVKISI